MEDLIDKQEELNLINSNYKSAYNGLLNISDPYFDNKNNNVENNQEEVKLEMKRKNYNE